MAESKPLKRYLTRDSVLALGLVGLLAIGSYLVTDRMVEARHASEAAIAISADQRELSQRLSMMATRLEATPAWEDWEAVHWDLQKTRDRFVANHQALTSMDPARGLSGDLNPALQAVYYGDRIALNAKVAEFVAAADRVLAAEPGATPSVDVTRLYDLARGPLLNGLTEASDIHAILARQALDTVRSHMSILLAATLTALGMIGLFIFRPMVRRVLEAHEEVLEAKRQMEHGALHDSLTGLPNRRYLNEYLISILANAQRNGHIVGLLHVDLDKFKEVNDTHGHAAGDTVLKVASAVMQAAVRRADFVARVGGDEFVIISPEVREPEGLGNLAERLVQRISEPVPYERETCQIGASVGIAFAWPNAPLDAERLMNNADIALYEAKNQGRGCYRIFEGDRVRLAGAAQLTVVSSNS